MSKKEVKTTFVTFEESLDPDFVEPSRWYILTATGDLCYYHCRSRVGAQGACDSDYGNGKYKIRTKAIEKSKGDITAR